MTTQIDSTKKLHHIAIAVRDLSSAKKIFIDLLGLQEIYSEAIDNQKIQLTMLKPSVESSETYGLELITPLDGNASLSKFLNNRGEGLHHVCYEVHDINMAIKEFTKKGLKILDGYPRLGSQNKQIAFFNPKDTSGTLIEICSSD